VSDLVAVLLRIERAIGGAGDGIDLDSLWGELVAKTPDQLHVLAGEATLRTIPRSPLRHRWKLVADFARILADAIETPAEPPEAT